MELVEVRCPLPQKYETNKECGKLCLKVTAGAQGEAFCPRCKKHFEFAVDDPQAISNNLG